MSNTTVEMVNVYEDGEFIQVPKDELNLDEYQIARVQQKRCYIKKPDSILNGELMHVQDEFKKRSENQENTYYSQLSKRAEREEDEDERRLSQIVPMSRTVLMDASGREIPMTLESINNLSATATAHGVALSNNSDEITKTVKIDQLSTDMQGQMTQVFELTKEIDPAKFKPRTGFFGKIIDTFTAKQQDMALKFGDVNTQIQVISDSMDNNINELQQHTRWIEKQYDDNKQYLFALAQEHANISAVADTEYEKLVGMQQELGNDPNAEYELAHQHDIVNALKMQADTVHRLLALSKVRALQLRSMRVANYHTITATTGVKNVHLAIWKQQIGMSIVNATNERSTAFLTKFTEMSDENLRKFADEAADNMKKSAIAASKPTISNDTLTYIADVTLKGVSEAMDITHKANMERDKAHQQLIANDEKMKAELRKIQEKGIQQKEERARAYSSTKY